MMLLYKHINVGYLFVQLMNIVHIIKLFWLYHLYEKLEYDFPVRQ